MKHHEREFFVATIRTGNVYIDELVIKPLTVEQSINAARAYSESIEKNSQEGVMTEDEMSRWMIQQELWHKADDNAIKDIEKAIDDTKVELYKKYKDKDTVKKLKVVLRALQSKHSNLYKTKTTYYSNTCEGIAGLDRTSWIIKNTTFLGDKLYDFVDYDVNTILSLWQQSLLKDGQIRELARNEPWRSLWSTYNKLGMKLFLYDNTYEITLNQKNLVVWSTLYDNIQESPDAPPEEVINDDDMLDGWFIEQGRKRKREQKKQQLEDSLVNKNISSSEEVYVMSKPDQVADIYDMNDPTSRYTIQQRAKEIEEKGTINHHELADQKLKLQRESNERFTSRGK